MRIEAHVLSVADAGDSLAITAQGGSFGAAEWRPYCKIEISIPMTEHAKKAYYIGRRFNVDLTPR